MKSEGAIRHKLKKVTFYHLKKAIHKKMAQKSWNCVHESESPERVIVEGKASVCYTCTVMGGPCDDTDNSLPSRARQCPKFEAKHDPQEIKAEFQSFLEEATPGELAYQYPDIHALLWVLEDDRAVGEMASSVEALSTEEVVPKGDPLLGVLGEVRDAMRSLDNTIASKPVKDPEILEQIEDLRSRLDHQPPAEAPRGFWSMLFSGLRGDSR